MKAIIMAGGEGTRLRPVSANKPKPMVELFDKPVLEHIIGLLRSNGITEACLTLKHLPQLVTGYFDARGSLGIHLEYRIETAPLGTAGGVLNCADFIGSEDVLIISGDCVCDFDLKALMRFHREKGAEATLALYSHEEPLEYGLVVTDGDGRITRFSEKPAWDSVVTDQINTGIYVLSPSVLERIPAGTPYDFGRELFPLLLKENRALYGCRMEGYWCDIGNVGAYLKCCRDFLEGKIRFAEEATKVREGLWSLSDIPDGVHIVPPVWIGRDVTLGRGAAVGPAAVIGASSVIAPDAEISRSVVCGARVGAGAVLTGTVVGRDAVIGRGCVLGEGSAVGDRTVVGENCLVGANTKIWPDKQLPANTVVSGTVQHGCLKKGVSFEKPGVVTGKAGVSLTTEVCLRLGMAAAAAALRISGGNQRVGVAWRGGDAARVLSAAFGCGVNTAGGGLLTHDGGFPACAAFAGQYFSLPLSVFFDGSDNVSVYFFGPEGSPISREEERKLESAWDADPAPTRTFGGLAHVAGAVEAYVSAAHAAASNTLRTAAASGLTVAVPGRSAENGALRQTLRRLGCAVVTDPGGGRIVFRALRGGMALAATDEEGAPLNPGKLQAILAYIELAGGVSLLAVPRDAPAAIDDMAAAFGAEILRVGRDGDRAGKLLARQRVLTDAVFAAAKIAAYLAARGETLARLRRRIPEYASVHREVPVRGNRGAVMRGLTSACAGMRVDTSSGLRIETENGIVRISPLRDRSAIRILAESFREELAEELCVEFERRALEADEKQA